MYEVHEGVFIARSLKVNGIVQGVGFRPYVYQLANTYDLKGEIANTSSGIILHVEGPQEKIDSFSKDLFTQSPPLAHITEISSSPVTVRNYENFIITESKKEQTVSTLISPDVCICNDCLKELLNPKDRRHRYPFINCTNCGPRYTIIDNLPYDRPYTSMKFFQMCDKCQAEYDDPLNRRFHAQPNACPVCGPHVTLYNNSRKKVATQDPIKKTTALLKQGNIIALKGLGGFHLVADAENIEVVKNLRKRKHREEKPFAIMSYDVGHIRSYAHMDAEEERIIKSLERPIVLLEKKLPNTISEQVSPRNKNYGVMLPYTPLHYLILQHDFRALVMTSANISEEPIVIDNDEAFERLSDVADFFLMHNRDIYIRSDDSIVKRIADNTRLIRRSRGYVPTPLFLKNKLPPILACGAELKNTICLTIDDKAFLSQHIGDLENFQAYEFFQMTIEHLKRILQIEPEIIAYDLHPDYLSTRYAEEQGDIKKIQVQHHHAHIVGCMAENSMGGEVIGLSFDGTGYGTDGAIWGGEVLICDEKDFKRAATLSYVPMPGSNAAIKEPWRMAVSYLYDAFGQELWNLDLPFIKEIGEENIKIIIDMIIKDINSPKTSSLGRLYDGIAAIVGIRNTVVFEGQAAMELEMMAEENIDTAYEYEWEPGDLIRILPDPIIRGIVEDMARGVSPSEISAKFHSTLIHLFSDLCVKIGKEVNINRVVMSGGAFQNSILLTGLINSLKAKGFKVFTNSIVPTNDGGISLGQAMVAAHRAWRIA